MIRLMCHDCHKLGPVVFVFYMFSRGWSCSFYVAGVSLDGLSSACYQDKTDGRKGRVMLTKGFNCTLLYIIYM